MRLDRPTYTPAQIAQIDGCSEEIFSPREIETFLHDGLPELHRIASENQITIAELLEDIHATWALHLGVDHPAGKRSIALEITNFKANLNGLESIIGRKKLKANHHARLFSVMWILRQTAKLLVRSHLRHHPTTHINPWAPMDQDYVTELLLASEQGLLDQAIIEAETISIRFKKENEAVEARRNWAKLLTEDSRRVESLVRPPFDVEDFDEYVAYGPPAQVPDTHVPTDIIRNLGLVLQRDEPLESVASYEAQTSKGTVLSITLSPFLLKQHDEGDRHVIRRLLRSILVGRSHAGIKRLSHLGDQVIEVRAVLHGKHKRILGCLEGRTVRLLKLIDLPADGNVYSRRIPKDLCD